MSQIFQALAAISLATTVVGGVAAGPLAVPAHAASLSERGAFQVADQGYNAKGRAEIIKLKDGGLGLKLSSDFKVRSGPDLRVWLSAASNPGSARSVKRAKHLELGRLRSSNGEQIYRIPKGASISDLSSVVIWCKAFGVNFGSAKLK